MSSDGWRKGGHVQHATSGLHPVLLQIQEWDATATRHLRVLTSQSQHQQQHLQQP